MSVITSGAHPKALWPGVKEWFGRSYAEHKPEYPELFELDTSEKAYEEDVGVTGFGLAPIKSEGGSVAFQAEAQGYTKRYTHVAYALGFIVTYEEMRDNLYEKVGKRRAQSLAFSMRQTMENVHANVYNRATTSGYTGGDGKTLLATDHPTNDGTQSNKLATAADLSEASLEDLLIQVAGAKNTMGLQISLMPKSLIVPRQLWFTANRILKSTLQNDTANNAVNVLKATNALPGGIVMNHYLTDADQWFVRTNAPRGMMRFERDMLELEQDNDFDTKNAKAFKYERYSCGWTDWRGVFGSEGA
jgi:hypothetical protein